MLYPQILNIKKTNRIKQLLMLGSFFLAGILVIVNFVIDSENHWSLLCILGLLYVWVTVIYSMKRNINIASHVMIQMIVISILTIGIDFVIGYKGWAMTIAVPIIIMAANLTMMILTIVSRKRYLKYAIYQMVIFILSMIPCILMLCNLIEYGILIVIATGIATFSLFLTILLCGREMLQESVRRFHF